MGKPKDKQKSSDGKPKRKPEPSADRNRAAETRRKKELIAKVVVPIGAAWPVVQVIYGAVSGHWRDIWFIVSFLIAIFLVAAFGCWWFSLKWLKSSGVLLLAAAILSLSGRYWYTQVPSLDSIMPANEPNPPLPGKVSAKDIPPDTTLIFTGGSLFGTTKTNLCVFKYNGDCLMSIQRSKSGASISGEFFGPNGDVVAVLDRNELITNSENIFRIKRDKHSLVIYDKHNVEIINLKFLNPRAFSFSGTFRLPDGQLLEVTDKFVRCGMDMNSGNVGLNADTAISLRGPPRKK